VHILLQEFKNFSQVILKYSIIKPQSKSYTVGSPTKNKDSASLHIMDIMWQVS